MGNKKEVLLFYLLMIAVIGWFVVAETVYPSERFKYSMKLYRKCKHHVTVHSALRHVTQKRDYHPFRGNPLKRKLRLFRLR